MYISERQEKGNCRDNLGCIWCSNSQLSLLPFSCLFSSGVNPLASAHRMHFGDYDTYPDHFKATLPLTVAAYCFFVTPSPSVSSKKGANLVLVQVKDWEKSHSELFQTSDGQTLTAIIYPAEVCRSKANCVNSSLWICNSLTNRLIVRTGKCLRSTAANKGVEF